MIMNAALLNARKLRGLTQAQIAKLAGIDRTVYTRIERGQRIPTVNTAIIIADILQVDVENIFMPVAVNRKHNSIGTCG